MPRAPLDTVVPGVLREAAAWPDPPFEVGRSTEPAGLDIELLRAVAAELAWNVAPAASLGRFQRHLRGPRRRVPGRHRIRHDGDAGAPGDVLVAADSTGSGHRWRIVDDAPWRRLYVELDPSAATAKEEVPGAGGSG